MGNQLLTRVVAGSIFGISLLYGEITINDIDRLVNDIKQERKGLSIEEIRKAKDPFVYFGKRQPSYLKRLSTLGNKRPRFYLTAIVNDHVKINNRWYRLHSKVHGYTIRKVGKDYVILSKGDSNVRVYLRRAHSRKIKLIAK